VYLSYEEHDNVTANTQAVTHAAFLSMGTAWASAKSYPWEHGYYVGGIETVKVNIMLRIYANNSHVYAGLAILNPTARVQIDQFAKSVTGLFKLMLAGDKQALQQRLYRARDLVFRDADLKQRTPILLSEDILDQFSLSGKSPIGNGAGFGSDGAFPPRGKDNSHLSLLAMVDCWAELAINPFVHLDLASTPLFRLFLGVAEYLFRSPERLDAAIHAAVNDVTFRYDDVEFVVAARGWSDCVSFGNIELYRRRFEETSAFFRSRFDEANKLGSEMIKALSNNDIKS